MGDVLVDDPQTLRVDGENKRFANLSERLQGGKRVEADGRVVISNGGSASVVATRRHGRGCRCRATESLRAKAWNGDGSIGFDGDGAVAELQRSGDGRQLLRAEGEVGVSFGDVQRIGSAQVRVRWAKVMPMLWAARGSRP